MPGYPQKTYLPITLWAGTVCSLRTKSGHAINHDRRREQLKREDAQNQRRGHQRQRSGIEKRKAEALVRAQLYAVQTRDKKRCRGQGADGEAGCHLSEQSGLRRLHSSAAKALRSVSHDRQNAEIKTVRVEHHAERHGDQRKAERNMAAGARRHQRHRGAVMALSMPVPFMMPVKAPAASN